MGRRPRQSDCRARILPSLLCHLMTGMGVTSLALVSSHPHEGETRMPREGLLLTLMFNSVISIRWPLDKGRFSRVQKKQIWNFSKDYVYERVLVFLIIYLIWLGPVSQELRQAKVLLGQKVSLHESKRTHHWNKTETSVTIQQIQGEKNSLIKCYFTVYKNNLLLIKNTLNAQAPSPQKTSFSRKLLNKRKKTIYRKLNRIKGKHHTDGTLPERTGCLT